MTTTHHTFCRICEALCGLRVEVDGDRVVSVRPDDQHVGTQGFGCVKGMKQHLLYSSPDRILAPLERQPDGSRREVAWSDAMARIGAKVRAIVDAHGPDAIAMYVGTAAGFSLLHPIFAQGFMDGVGSKSMYSSATQDCANKFAVATHVYGFPFTQPFPDVDRTECLIIVGANPAMSKWSFAQVSNPVQRIKDIERRGGRVFVVDPRRTETARAAGTHVFIQPTTDVFFYLSFLHEVAARDGIQRARVAQHMKGLDAVLKLAAEWPPERTAEATGIPPDTLREMVTAYLAADGAALYSSTGVNMGRNGALAFWLQEVINAVTGNLDRPGGTVVGQGVLDLPSFGKKHGVLLRKDRSRVGDLPSVNDAFPGGVLADEILTPGKGQVRAVFVTGGNPLMTMANSGRLKQAFGELDLLVCLDLFVNETASLAHYVLPATSPLERPDLPFIFPFMLGMQTRPYLQATEPVLPPPGNVRDEASIYVDLCRASGFPIFGSRVAQMTLQLASARDDALGLRVPQARILSLLLRLAGQGSFKRLLRDTHGRAVEAGGGPGTYLGARVLHDDGRVDLAPPLLLEQAAARLGPAFERIAAEAGTLRLITKRQVVTHNSWTHNHEAFVSREHHTNHLYVHPDDAARLGLEAGALADVESATATVRLPVRISDDLMPGCVALPHGWGHQHAEGLSVANQTRGVNVNLLAADGPEALEPISGMAHLTGIPVQVRPAAGPRAHTWSGIEVGAEPQRDAGFDAVK